MANQLFSKGLANADSLLPSVRIFVTTVFILMKFLRVAEANATNEELETKRLKYILVWTSNNAHPVKNWIHGQKKLIEYKCPVSDCYITSRRDFFGEDITKFNAVIFNGRNLKNTILSELPRDRSPRQKYIYLNDESADNQPICSSIFDGFFNWTATYKLDSDIVNGYLEINNAAGEVVGPSIDMNWRYEMSDFNDTLLSILKRKTKAAAWFASHCGTRGGRESYVAKLKVALKKHNLTMDIYGKCGFLKCKTGKNACINMLRDNYFFYLAFENSIVTDYITEKVLTALASETVPILFGGADYSRFLPYGSYIDARIHEPKRLASFMAVMINNPEEYREFFRWRNFYTYRTPNNILCRICAALHEQPKFEAHSVYQDFRGWWNPNYEERCEDKSWGT